MIIRKIYIKDFRNFDKKLLEFSSKTTVIVGPNASGKTNIIEGIHLLSTGKSFRARVEEEMIAYDEELTRVKGLFKEGEDDVKLEVVLTRGEITVGEDPEKTEKVARKRLLINGVGKRLIDFAGTFRIVLFAPWHLDLVTESPSGRRNFLDDVLSQVDREYRRALLSYSKGLRRRNKVLYRVREEGASRSQLTFWNKLLIKNGDYISKRRREFIEFANAGNFQFSHQHRGSDSNITTKYKLEYDPSVISDSRLEQYKEEEVAAATTLVGPHRDDMIFKIEGQRSKVKDKSRELARYGSRGEQRMGVLWLKLAELSFIEEEVEEKPALLLDDIFSELDHEHREIVFSVIKGQQTIVTTADPHYIENLKKVEKIEIRR